MLHKFLGLNTTVKTLTNLRLDWSWSVSKGVAKLKISINVFLSSQVKQKKLQDFYWNNSIGYLQVNWLNFPRRDACCMSWALRSLLL